MCQGSRRYSAGGYSDPLNPDKWCTCPYCDNEGLMYIEPTVEAIINYIERLPAAKREVFLQKLKVIIDL